MTADLERIAYDLRIHGNVPPLPHTTQRLHFYALGYRCLASYVHEDTFERKDIFVKNPHNIFLWRSCYNLYS